MQTLLPSPTSLRHLVIALFALALQVACFMPPSGYTPASSGKSAEPPRYATVDCAATRFCGPGEVCRKQPGEIFKQCVPGPDSASRGCTTDFECGYNKACVKGFGEYHGFCAQRVNATGGPTYAPAPAARFGPDYTRDCYYDFDCGVLFRCSDGRCIKR